MKELEIFREYLLFESFEKVDPFKWEKNTDSKYTFNFETGDGDVLPYKVTFNNMSYFGRGLYELQFQHESKANDALEQRTDRGQLNKIFWTLVDIINDFISVHRRKGLRGITYDASNRGNETGGNSSRASVYEKVLASKVPTGILDQGFNKFKEIFTTDDRDDSNVGLIYNPKFLNDQEIEKLENRLDGEDQDDEYDNYYN